MKNSHSLRSISQSVRLFVLMCAYLTWVYFLFVYLISINIILFVRSFVRHQHPPLYYFFSLFLLLSGHFVVWILGERVYVFVYMWLTSLLLSYVVFISDFKLFISTFYMLYYGFALQRAHLNFSSESLIKVQKLLSSAMFQVRNTHTEFCTAREKLVKFKYLMNFDCCYVKRWTKGKINWEKENEKLS